MSVRLAADAEKLLGDYLRSRTEITALVGERVVTDLPASPTFPLVRYQRIGGKWDTDAERLDAPMFQIEAWANVGQRGSASMVSATVRAALNNDPGGVVKTHDLGVVTGTEEIQGPAWLPDPPTGRARFVFTVRLYVHP